MSTIPSASGGEQRPATDDLFTVAPEERCTKNLPDGGHLWKLPTFPGFPRFCAYCGARKAEGGAS